MFDKFITITNKGKPVPLKFFVLYLLRSMGTRLIILFILSFLLYKLLPILDCNVTITQALTISTLIFICREVLSQALGKVLLLFIAYDLIILLLITKVLHYAS